MAYNLQVVELGFQPSLSARLQAAFAALYLSLGAGFVCGLALSVSECQSLRRCGTRPWHGL